MESISAPSHTFCSYVCVPTPYPLPAYVEAELLTRWWQSGALRRRASQWWERRPEKRPELVPCVHVRMQQGAPEKQAPTTLIYPYLELGLAGSQNQEEYVSTARC